MDRFNKKDPALVIAVALATIGTVATAVVAITRYSSSSSSQKTPESSTTDGKLQLFGFLPVGDFPDSSPACIKLATFLAMCKVPFDHIHFPKHQFKDCPRNKVPWVRTPLLNDGKPVSDSAVIISKLKGVDPDTFELDTHLSPTEKAIGTAFKVMCEESLYWNTTVATRWRSIDQHRKVTMPTYFGSVPKIFHFLIDLAVTKKMRRDGKGQGMMLYSDDELLMKATSELEALSEYLGSKTYFMSSDRVSSFDATIFAYLAVSLQGDWDHPILDKVRSFANLVAYVERMRVEFFPEYNKPAVIM